MFYIRKEFNSHRVGLLGRRLTVLEHQNGRRVVMVRNSQDGLLPRKQSLRIIFLALRRKFNPRYNEVRVR